MSTPPSPDLPATPDLGRTGPPSLSWRSFLLDVLGSLPRQLDCVSFEQGPMPDCGHGGMFRLAAVAGHPHGPCGHDETLWHVVWCEGEVGGHLAVTQVDEGCEPIAPEGVQWRAHDGLRAALHDLTALLTEAADGPIPFEDDEDLTEDE